MIWSRTHTSLLIPLFSPSLQMMTPSACTLKCQRQPVPTPCHSSPKWTLAKVTENKYHIFPLKAIAETRRCWIKCLKMWQFMWWTRMLPPSIRSGSLWLYRAQPGRGSCSVRVWWAAKQSCVLYKGMDETMSLENQETHGRSRGDSLGERIHVCVLVPDIVCPCAFQELEKVLSMSHQNKDKDSWKEESGWVCSVFFFLCVLLKRLVRAWAGAAYAHSYPNQIQRDLQKLGVPWGW